MDFWHAVKEDTVAGKCSIGKTSIFYTMNVLLHVVPSCSIDKMLYQRLFLLKNPSSHNLNGLRYQNTAGGFLKCWVFPNKPMDFPGFKNDQPLGCEMGVYHYLRKHPYGKYSIYGV